jgi:hypothetical protein
MKRRIISVSIVLFAVILQFTSCSTPSPTASGPRFTEEKTADFITWYYSDETSYVVKPATMDGVFLYICDRALVLKLAGQQPRRDLAVLVLTRYPNEETENSAKLAWVKELKGLGYQRIVFVRGGLSMQVTGLPILESPQVSATLAGEGG